MVQNKNDRILIIEDEKEIASLLERYLNREGYDVQTVTNITQAEARMESGDPSLVILDLMLPDGDGLRLCRDIRRRLVVPIIILTAKDTQLDKIRGLETGADDYVTKPFDINELVARVRSQLRRVHREQGSEPASIVLRGLEINIETRTVTVAGVAADLSPIEFDLLVLLARNPGTVFTKDRIIHAIYPPDTHIDENTLNVHVRRLRKKIEPDPDYPSFIITVWKIGFKFQGEPR